MGVDRECADIAGHVINCEEQAHVVDLCRRYVEQRLLHFRHPWLGGGRSRLVAKAPQVASPNWNRDQHQLGQSTEALLQDRLFLFREPSCCTVRDGVKAMLHHIEVRLDRGAVTVGLAGSKGLGESSHEELAI